MTYTQLNYNEFGSYKVERVGTLSVKKFTWNKQVTREELNTLLPHFHDDRTKVFLETTTAMPFSVYLIPYSEASLWWNYLKTQQELSKLFNCVYLLFGHDYIYAGKSTNGDRILGHIADEAKDGFEYQMLFVPNNDNANTWTNWTSDFMNYLESLLIERIGFGNNPYCKNAIHGKSRTKNVKALNMNETKEQFAENVINLMIDAFADITCSSYLIPNYERQGQTTVVNVEEDDKTIEFWKKLQKLQPDTEFAKLSPSKRNSMGKNINKIIAGHSVDCIFTRSTCRVALVGWGNCTYAESNHQIFNALLEKKDEIETEMGCQLTWEGKEDRFTTSISVSKSLSAQDDSIGNLRDMADFFAEYLDKFCEVFPKYAPKVEVITEAEYEGR